MSSSFVKKLLLNAVAYPAFFMFWLLLGAYWTFPYERLRDFVVQQAEASGAIELDIAKLEPSWLTGIELEGVRVRKLSSDSAKPAQPLTIQKLDARISLLALLTGKIEVSYSAKLLGGGTIEGIYATSSDATRLKATLTNVDLGRLGPLHDTIGLPVAGRARGSIDMTIASEAKNSSGQVDLTFADVAIGDGETPLVIEGMGAGITLEQLELGDVNLEMKTERGVATLQRLEADGEHAELRGGGTMRLVQPMRASTVDLLVRIKLKDAYRNSSDRMRALFTLLDANPQVRPARTPDGAFQWRIQGAIGTRIRMIPSGRASMPIAN